VAKGIIKNEIKYYWSVVKVAFFYWVSAGYRGLIKEEHSILMKVMDAKCPGWYKDKHTKKLIFVSAGLCAINKLFNRKVKPKWPKKN
jgi:hypothetical protein